MQTIKRRFAITATLLVIMSVTAFAPLGLISNLNSDNEIENAYNGSTYLTNYTFNTMTIDGNLNLGPSEWDANSYTITDPNNDNYVYFQWDYDYLYFGFLYSDGDGSAGDNVTLYLDVDGDESLSDGVDLRIMIFYTDPGYALSYGRWSAGSSDYVAAGVPDTLMARAVYNASGLDFMNYEMRIPMSNLTNPYNSNMGFNIEAYDIDTSEYTIDKDKDTLSEWNDLQFNYAVPSISEPEANMYGGFNDTTRFEFTTTYTSSVNRPPKNVYLNITGYPDPSITMEFKMDEEFTGDEDCTDGKSYIVVPDLSSMPEGWYYVRARSDDGNTNETSYFALIYLYDQTAKFGIFDGLTYEYDFDGFFGLVDAYFEDTYSEMGGGLWTIEGDSNYPGASSTERLMELPGRNFTLSTGSYPFDDETHEWSFVPTDLEVDDTIMLSVIRDGDTNFTVVSNDTVYNWAGEEYYVYRLENASSYAFYERQTGLMLYASYDIAGTLYDYELTLDSTNAFDNLFAPKLIEPNVSVRGGLSSVGEINSTIDFHIAYFDFDNQTSEQLSVTLMNGTEEYGTFDLELDLGYGSTDRSTGVSYQTSLVLWNTSFAEGWKNYTTIFNANDGRFVDSLQAAAPNVSYINNKDPVLYNGGTDPWLTTTNDTAVSFNVTYSDEDNNFPEEVRLHVENLGMFKMSKSTPNDHDYMGGIVYEYTLPVIDLPGVYEYNFSVIDQEGNPFNSSTAFITISDGPPNIDLVTPKSGFQVGNDFTVEITSTSGDIDEIWYNIKNTSETVLPNTSYTLGSPQDINDLYPGTYNLTAYLNDTGAGTVVSEMHTFTVTQDPYFNILFVDMDNSTLDSVYIDAFKEIGFREGRDYDVMKHFPTIGDLAEYEIMILATGASEYDWSVNDSVLCDYVNGGGNVYISGQNYYDNGLTNFMENFTGVTSIGGIVSENGIDGYASSPVSSGLSINLAGLSGYENYTVGDQKVTELFWSGVEILFENENDDVLGVLNKTGNGRIVVTSFEFARVTDNVTLMERIIYWLANSSSITVESPLGAFYQAEGVWLNTTSIDPSLDTVTYSVYNNTHSEWAFTNVSILPTSDNWIPLEEGDYTIYVWTNNTWGFRPPTTYTQSFRCDITAPTVSINTPLNQTYLVYDDFNLNFDVSSSASDLDVVTVSLYNWSSSTFIWLNVPWDASDLSDNYLMGEGYYTFVVYGTDESGNIGETVNVNFTVEFVPSVSIVEPDEEVYATSQVPINITAISNDGIDTIFYDIINESSGLTLYDNLVYDELIPSTYTTPALPDGDYRIWAYANDTEGNISFMDTDWEFEIDTTAPTLTIYTDLSDDNVNWINDDEVEIFYWSFDGRLDDLWYSIYYSDGLTWITSGNVTYDGDFFGLPADTITGLDDGDYVAFLYGNDSLGNEVEVIRYFVIDTSAPEFDQTLVSTTDINTPIDINLFGTDDTSLDSATLYYNATGITGTQSISMTKINTWEFNATIPAFSYGTVVTYWFELSDGFDQTNTSTEATFTIKGLASDGDYIFNYTEEFQTDLVFNVSVAGDLDIEFVDANPEATEITGATHVLSYITIEFSGTMESAQLRFYYEFGVDFENIRLYHYVSGAWQQVELTESEDGTYVYADLDSFSSYALVQMPNTTDLFSDIALGLIIGLGVAFVLAMVLFLRTRKRYVDEIGGTPSKSIGKGKDTGYSAYDTEYPEKQPYETVDKRAKMKRAAKAEEKRKKLEGKAEAADEKVSTEKAKEKPAVVTKAEVSEAAESGEERDAEYYCESCKESHILPLDMESPQEDCPECGNAMGIKVTCQECGASFQVKPEQYKALIKQKTPCPKCSTPLA